MRNPAAAALGVAITSCLLLPASAWAVIDVDAGDDVTLECESEDGAEYTLNGSGPDLEGIEVEWTTDPLVALDNPETLTPTGEFGLGDTIATRTATTDSDNGSDDVKVTVEDTTSPVVRATAEPFYLWPPNHEMEEVRVRLRIRDRCTDEDDFEVKLIRATSSEPDNSTGDGNTVNDIQGDNIGTDDRRVLLRAERKGNGDGRVYRLVYRVTDAEGNSTEAVAKVYVPHDASDLKDLIDDIDDGHGGFEPICPRPRDALDEFEEALPSPRHFATERACARGCKAWGRGCRGIVRGTRHCVRSEIRSLVKLHDLMCREDENRDSSRRCRDRVREGRRHDEDELKITIRGADDSCRDEADSCEARCERYFEIEPFDD